MHHGLSDSTVKLIVDCFSSFPHLQKVKLYGSRAMGTYRNGSDIDLAVWFDNEDLRQSNHLKMKLEELPTPYKFDVTDYPLLDHTELKDHIDRIGKTIYKKGYKKTELGWIPDEWDVQQLSNLAKISSGSTPKRDQYEKFYKNGNIPWVKTLDLNNGDITTTDECITEIAIQETSCKLLPIGTILLAMYGGFNQILRIPATTNQAISGLQVDESKLHSDYLLFCLNYRVDDWKKFAASSRNDPNITKKDIEKFKIIYGSLPEQKKIADILSTVDSKIESIEQQIQQTEQLKKGLMQQLLTQGIGHTEFKETEIGRIPKSWEVKKLGDIIENLYAGVSVNLEDKLIENDNEYGILKTSCLNGNEFDPNEHKRILADEIGRAKLNPKKDTILISRMNTPDLVGMSAYVGDDYESLFVPDRLWQTKFYQNVNVNVKWLSDVFSSFTFKKTLKNIATGTSGSMKNISKSAFLNIKIAFPQHDEQLEISNILESISEKIRTILIKKQSYKILKKGLMQKLLTGQIRVKVN